MKIKYLIPVLFLIGACSGQTSTEQSEATTADRELAKGQSTVQDDVSDPNILQIAAGSEAHTTLVAAIQAAGLEDVLANSGPFTVFAPTNEAFDALPEGTVSNLLKPENKSQLVSIIYYLLPLFHTSNVA